LDILVLLAPKGMLSAAKQTHRPLYFEKKTEKK